MDSMSESRWWSFSGPRASAEAGRFFRKAVRVNLIPRVFAVHCQIVTEVWVPSRSIGKLHFERLLNSYRNDSKQWKTVQWYRYNLFNIEYKARIIPPILIISVPFYKSFNRYKIDSRGSQTVQWNKSVLNTKFISMIEPLVMDHNGNGP